MHIYLGQMYPLQLTIDVWNTTTPNKFNIYQDALILLDRCTSPSPIDHRCIIYCYTTEVSHIAECTYTKVPPPLIDHRSMEYHYTTSL